MVEQLMKTDARLQQVENCVIPSKLVSRESDSSTQVDRQTGELQRQPEYNGRHHNTTMRAYRSNELSVKNHLICRKC